MHEVAIEEHFERSLETVIDAEETHCTPSLLVFLHSHASKTAGSPTTALNLYQHATAAGRPVSA